MRDRTMDRRAARTREMLQRALASLTLEKGYEAVTITDICRAANVSRSTFYGHFSGKDDLKRRGMEKLRRQIVDRQRSMPADDGERSLGFSLPMFEHARDHKKLYDALVGSRGGTVALATIRQILVDFVREALAKAEGTRRAAPRVIPRELVVQYVVGAFMAVLTWWLDGGAKLPPEKVDAMFRSLAMDGVARAKGVA